MTEADVDAWLSANAPPAQAPEPDVAPGPPEPTPSAPPPTDAPSFVGRVAKSAKEALPALGYGVARGATLGAVDRLAGLGTGFGDAVASWRHGLQRDPNAIDSGRAEYLAAENKERQAHPIANIIGEGLGGSVPAIASGGVSAVAPTAAAAPSLAEAVAPILARPATKLAAQGFAAGALNERSPEALAQLKSGITGAALGAGANALSDKLLSPLIAGATKREARGLVESIVRNEETGASATPTAKKLLMPKLAAAVKELRQDPVLAEAARTDAARAGRIVSSKISAISQDRPQFYADLDSAVPPLKVTDLYKAVHQVAKTADNPSEQAALEAFQSEIDSHWLPKWKEQGLLIPQQGQALGIGSLGVRDWVSQAQEGAANTIGQINQSLAKQRQDALKHVATELWQDHLDKAAEKAPEAVASIRAYDARYSALASMRKVFQQRTEKEAAGTTGLGAMLGKAAEPLGTGIAAGAAFMHPEAAIAGYLGMQAAKRAPQAARSVNDHVLVPLQQALEAGGGKMGWAEFAKLALEKGLPQGIAKSLYERFHRGTP